MRKIGIVLLGGALLALGLAPTSQAGSGSEISQRGMAGKRSVWAAATQGKKPGSTSNIECSVASAGANTNLDCDDPYPNNEPDIEVDPADPLHMVASSNDYGTCCDEFYTTFDGGQSWQTGNMSNEGPTRIGSDPVTVFDTNYGTVIHPSLNFTASGNWACDGDLVVSISTDGGLVWGNPILVADGSGCDVSATQVFHDKEWIVVDNNPTSPDYGTAYLTWSAFISHKGVYASSAIWEAHSTDGGYTWSAPQEISGSNPALCTYQEDGPGGVCDENQFSVPTVAPDGTVYVAFENEQNQALWEPGELFDDQYLLVSSTDGGANWSAPTFVVGLEDGSRDYPINGRDRQTLTGYQIRVNSAGNIVADPSGRLSLVFSDNRAGAHDVDAPVTNTNVYLMTSTDGGATWNGPALVDSSTSDQWFPWVEVNPADGTVSVVYNDRDRRNPAVYNVTLAQARSGVFRKTRVATASSHPTQSIFFKAGVAGCEACATFHGDYINLSYGSDGRANLVWTDMRDFDPTLSGYRQWIYFARI